VEGTFIHILGIIPFEKACNPSFFNIYFAV
jgi:hypothetical protein